MSDCTASCIAVYQKMKIKRRREEEEIENREEHK